MDLTVKGQQWSDEGDARDYMEEPVVRNNGKSPFQNQLCSETKEPNPASPSEPKPTTRPAYQQGLTLADFISTKKSRTKKSTSACQQILTNRNVIIPAVSRPTTMKRPARQQVLTNIASIKKPTLADFITAEPKLIKSRSRRQRSASRRA
eukprot:Protomagalhaensia_wolfi_Nauph_80__3998@NODE_4056_length_649_cov_81_450820_g3213_i0_p1_GENE_NODE_4056_length_649_cov_81_450820_g3213_i0NODE_4056_length_649_cov_81_450820_g3213_i0_p1_ORF_typecomplete_len150_score19_52_NODE_4056_length_649_cov_81_450820_g3213_i066515